MSSVILIWSVSYLDWNFIQTGHFSYRIYSRKEIKTDKLWCYYRSHSEGKGKVMFSQASFSHPWGGVHPSGWWGYPLPRSGHWGTRSQVRTGGYPGIGYPPPDRPSPRSGQGGVFQLEQLVVYLPRGGRYASCAHAGGLSCYLFVFELGTEVLSRLPKIGGFLAGLASSSQILKRHPCCLLSVCPSVLCLSIYAHDGLTRWHYLWNRSHQLILANTS